MNAWFTCWSMRRSRMIFLTLSDRTTTKTNVKLTC